MSAEQNGSGAFVNQ